ncbi:hypothetical protein OHS18_42010 [Amycolatopsis sp. NBC_00355]|uniref:hypothetical protein n=1 Tax=Amycolatopsis sp. NBC_00355 TaxID=2975957 RepID=UPI002E26FFC8
MDNLLKVRAFFRPDTPATTGIIEDAGGTYVGAVENEQGVGVLLAAVTPRDTDRFVILVQRAEYPAGLPCRH